MTRTVLRGSLLSMMNDCNADWLIVAGRPDPELSVRVADAVRLQIEKGEFADRDVRYIADLSRPILNEKLSVSPERLQKLRTLCQLWDLDIRATKITSHRKILGPIIVSVKRALLPILKMLLRDTINQQRDFNATAISLLTDISNELDKRQ